MDDLDLVAGDDVAPADLHATFVAAFADYLAGPFQAPLAQWPSFLARQAIDLRMSRVALRHGRPIAFALTTPRPARRRWRLAVMGALPQARGSGAAAALLDEFIARAGAQGLPEVELECFAQNERALAFYRGRGFEAAQELRGWSQAPRPADSDSASTGAGALAGTPREVDRATAFAWIADVDQRLPDLPQAFTPASLGAAVRPLTFWQLGSAQLVFSAVDATPIQIHALIDTGDGQLDAQVLLHRLRLRHPADEIAMPPLQRDDLGGDAMRREGYVVQALHQVLMVRRL